MNEVLQRAIRWQQGGQIAEAEGVYREILDREPQNAEVMQLLGLAECQHGRYQEGVKWIGKALELEPGNAEWWMNLGEVQRRMGQAEAAVESLRRAVELAPGNAYGHYNLGVALGRPGGEAGRQGGGAAESYRRAVELMPAMAEAWNNLGYLLVESGEHAEAVACYEKLAVLKPGQPEVENNLGRALWEAGRHEEALAAFERAVELKQEFWPAHGNLGTALRKLGRREAAVAAYQRAEEDHGGLAEMQCGLGTALMEAGHFAEAEATCRRAVELMPGDAEGHRRLGMALALLGRRAEALAAYEEALRLREESGEAADDWRFEWEAMRGNQEVRGAPELFVRRLFDGYALRFEEHLVGELGYRMPEELEKAVGEVLGSQPVAEVKAEAGTMTGGGQWNVLDLGCGTGLCGARFRKHARRLVGVDLAPKMIELSRGRKIYDELIAGDIVEAMRGFGDGALDVIVAGDVFIYVGGLESVFPEAGRALRRGGVMAFSLEQHEEAGNDGGKGFALTRGARFAHSLAYVWGLARKAGLEVVIARETFLRGDVGKGWVVVVRR